MNKKKKRNATLIFPLLVLVIAFAAVAGWTFLRRADLPVGAPVAGQPQPTPDATEPTLTRDAPGHKTTVVLDAGHGFGDVGCGGPDSPLRAWEKDMTIDMVRTLKACLEARGYTVLLTHDGTSFPTCAQIAALCDTYGVEYDPSKEMWKDDNIFSPYERVIYMNALDAQYGVNYALSVHVNANVDSDQLNGFDLDYCKENRWSQDSKRYADKLRERLLSAYPGRNLWYYEDSWDEAFVVTKYNTMPSALLETGYYTNASDAALLRDKAWRNKLMNTVCDAVSEVLQ